MKIRAEKVDKSYRVLCPCQSTTKKGTQGILLSSIKGNYEIQKDGKDTAHTRWVANLKLAMRCNESVIGITEANGYWKHKYIFNTKRMAVFVFFPRERPNPCVLTYTITPSCAVELVSLPPLVPTFLNEVAKKLEIVSDTLEPQEGNLDAFLLVSSARQTLMQWNDDATSSSGESLHSLQPLELPQLLRSETTDEDEEQEQEDDVPTEVKTVPSSTNDDNEPQLEEEPVATSSNASASADDSIADRVKREMIQRPVVEKLYRDVLTMPDHVADERDQLQIDRLTKLLFNKDNKEEAKQQQEEPVATQRKAIDLNEEHVMKILYDIYDFSDGDEDIYELIGFIQKNIQQKFKRGGKKLKEFFTWLHGYATTFYNNQLKELTEKKKIDEAHEHLKEIEKLLSSFGRQ